MYSEMHAIAIVIQIAFIVYEDEWDSPNYSAQQGVSWTAALVSRESLEAALFVASLR